MELWLQQFCEVVECKTSKVYSNASSGRTAFLSVRWNSTSRLPKRRNILKNDLVVCGWEVRVRAFSESCWRGRTPVTLLIRRLACMTQWCVVCRGVERGDSSIDWLLWHRDIQGRSRGRGQKIEWCVSNILTLPNNFQCVCILFPFGSYLMQSTYLMGPEIKPQGLDCVTILRLLFLLSLR